VGPAGQVSARGPALAKDWYKAVRIDAVDCSKLHTRCILRFCSHGDGDTAQVSAKQVIIVRLCPGTQLFDSKKVVSYAYRFLVTVPQQILIPSTRQSFSERHLLVISIKQDKHNYKPDKKCKL